MKKQILILGVAGLLGISFSNADVDKVVQKPVQYFCQNSEVGYFKLTADQGTAYKIEFSADKFKNDLQGADTQLHKIEKSNFLNVAEFEISKNTQVVANLIISESKVQSGFSNCGRASRAPCDFPVYKIEINAELTMDQMTYDFVCSKN